MKLLLSLLFLLIATGAVQAQSTDGEPDKVLRVERRSSTDSNKSTNSISITNEGIHIGKTDTAKKEKVFQIHIGRVDLGFNRIDDKTQYTSTPEMIGFLGYDPAAAPGKTEVLPLREGKSINVNVWPILGKYRLLNGKTQRIYVASGIGLQMYNFRWEGTANYTDQPYTQLKSFDNLHIQKNKLGLTYLSIPLELQFRTRLAPKATLVYGFGITGGYRIASWTKIKSMEHGKQKNHDDFNFRDFNSCITAEFGLSGYFRLYGSYQLTSLHEDILDQHPYCIGIRFMGL